MAGKPGCGGKKGRSGRKPWDKEVEIRELWDLSIPVLKRALKSDNTATSKKIEIAMYLVGKMLPKQMEVSGEGGEAVKIIYEIAKPPKDKDKT